MSRRRELARRLAALTDIADILGAMKSLALMETRILLGFLACQERMVAGIEAALGEFLAWHPELVQPSARSAEEESGDSLWSPASPTSGAKSSSSVPPFPGEAFSPTSTTASGKDVQPPATLAPETALWVLVGTEQGFCGDFNARLAARVQDPEAWPLAGRWILVGQRLAAKLGEDPRIILQLPGATVADEVPAVLLQLTREINRLLMAGEPAVGGLGVLYQEEAQADPRLRPLLPLQAVLLTQRALIAPTGRPFVSPRCASAPLSPLSSTGPPTPPGAMDSAPSGLLARIPARRAFAPAINLPPGELLASLTHHYLYAVLNEVLYSSLTAENRQRQTHMDQALQRLETRTERLRRACNAQRQEEITEEIEILLLSADRLAGSPYSLVSAEK